MEWKILAYRVGIILMKPLFHRSDDVLDKFLPGDDPEPYEMKIDALLTKFVWVTICCRRSLGDRIILEGRRWCGVFCVSRTGGKCRASIMFCNRTEHSC
ncbi:hypothetical protein BaRGS_00022199 [Batillaria attramentaria]|uniref:Uncharacterized protein n=1 Tax=Batillaria attramentaria TaxID=370345 RepID=A0ABD0KH16_9CAEN